MTLGHLERKATGFRQRGERIAGTRGAGQKAKVGERNGPNLFRVGFAF